MRYNFCLFLICLFTFINLSTYAQEEHERIEGGTNSSANEADPVVSPDGQTLYFVRQYHPQNVGGIADPGDIWYSELQADGSWGEAQHSGKTINNSYYNAILGFPNAQTAYVQGHYVKGKKKPTTQGISTTQGKGSQWSFPESVNIPYYYTKSNHLSGSLHSSNNIMIVTLQSYDTRGAEDLYVLFKQSDGSWSEPKNLGNNINTPYQEMTPFLAPDGKTLFFASNGYEGFGSRDIFMSVRLDDSWRRWSNPKNLGATVNTPGTELYYRIPQNSEFAYLSSTQNSDGMADIVRVRISPEEEEVLEEADSTLAIPEERPIATTQPPIETNTDPEIPEEAPDTEVDEVSEPMILVRGTIAGESSQQPLSAEVIFQSLKKDTPLLQTVQTDSLGEFSVSLPRDDDYSMLVQSEGFIRKRDKVLLSVTELDETDVIVRNYQLTPIEVGVTVNLENVLFDRGTAHMLPGSDERLDEVVEFLQENPNVSIEVGGHTDNQGRADLNLELSRQRAETVRDYLVNQGGDATRITAKGYGGTKPLASNAIEEERSKNRRVEFTIVKK